MTIAQAIRTALAALERHHEASGQPASPEVLRAFARVEHLAESLEHLAFVVGLGDRGRIIKARGKLYRLLGLSGWTHSSLSLSDPRPPHGDHP